MVHKSPEPKGRSDIMAYCFRKPLTNFGTMFLNPLSPPHVLQAWVTSQQCTQHVADGLDGAV